LLKKLINYILDHLDDEQAPPSIQNLQNNTFTCGFQAGYREAYKQWGEAVEERLDEAYQGGLRDGHKQCKGKQTMETCSEPMKTTAATVKMATQTKPAPKYCDITLQMVPTTSKTTNMSTQTTSTTSANVATHMEPLDNATLNLPSPVAASSPITSTQPPSTLLTATTIS
jgi:hypothetical protein